MLKRAPLIPGDAAVAPRARPSIPSPAAAHKRARKERDLVASTYDEAASYALPCRPGISTGPDSGVIYDDTAPNAVPEFASRIQQGVIPNFAHWTSFVVGLQIPLEEKPDVAAALAEIDSYLYTVINSSNFSTEAADSLQDLAIGTACFRIDERAGRLPFSTRAVPLSALDFGQGADGLPDPICETRKMLPSEIPVYWPDVSVPTMIANAEQEIEVREIWQRDWTQPEDWIYRQTVYLPGHQDHVLLQDYHRGEGANPYIVYRWSKIAGQAWGRGPLFFVLPSMRKVNYAERALLDHTDIAIAGIWTAEDDGVVNYDTVRLEAGVVVPRAPGSQPLQAVSPGGNFDIASFLMENSRMSIRKALFTEQLGPMKGTPMSATEVTQRMTELARAVGGPFGRLIMELVFPTVTRMVRILKDRKLIKLPVVDGREVALMPTSPLAMGYNFEIIDRIERFLSSIATLYGPQAVHLVSDVTEASLKLGELYHVPPGIVRAPDQQRQLAQQVAGQVAQSGAPAQEGANVATPPA